MNACHSPGVIAISRWPCGGRTAVAAGLSQSAAWRNSRYRDGAGGHLRWRAHDPDAGELGHRSPAHRSRWATRVYGVLEISLRVRSADQRTSGSDEGTSGCPDIFRTDKPGAQRRALNMKAATTGIIVALLSTATAGCRRAMRFNLVYVGVVAPNFITPGLETRAEAPYLSCSGTVRMIRVGILSSEQPSTFFLSVDLERKQSLWMITSPCR